MVESYEPFRSFPGKGRDAAGRERTSTEREEEMVVRV